MPRVRSGYEIHRDDGSVLTTSEPTQIRPTSPGMPIRLSGANLSEANLSGAKVSLEDTIYTIGG